MPKRKRKPRHDSIRRADGPRTALAADDVVIVARSLRSVCKDCGAEQLHWADLAGAGFLVRQPEQRAAFLEAIDAGMPLASPAWWCPQCPAVGIFTAA